MVAQVVAKETLSQLGIRRVTSAQGVVEYRLNINGLKILLKEDRTAPVVNFSVVYRAGSRDEGVGTTGSAHFFEHLMFKGTRAFDPLEGNGPMDVFGRIGAEINANTTTDRTAYYECVPAEHLELCARIEADRMRGLKNRVADRNAEMTVVRNEFERGENNPMRVLMQQVSATAFQSSGYHHPTIGWRDDVENVPMSRMKEFYDTYYWPNNATVIVVGDFESAEALAMIANHFGRIPRSPKPIPRSYSKEKPQEGERRIVVQRAGAQTLLNIGWHTPEATHADFFPLTVLCEILGGNSPGTRLDKTLVESGLCSSAYSFNWSKRGPFLMQILAFLNDDVQVADVEAAIYSELDKIASGSKPVSEADLARLKTANRKGTDMSQDDPMDYASMLVEAEAVDTWKWSIDYDDNFDKVTAQDVERVARTYLTEHNRTVGTFIPGESLVQASEEPAKQTHPRKTAPRKQRPIKLTNSPRGSNYAELVQQRVLANGLTISVLPRQNGSLYITGQTAAGSYFAAPDQSSAPALTAALLSTGSAHFSKQEISERVQEMGANLEFAAGAFASAFGAKLHPTDFELYVELLSDAIRRPNLAQDELTRVLQQQKATIANWLTDNTQRAKEALQQRIYPEGHPYHPVSLAEQLKQLQDITTEDLRQFHQAHYSPKSTALTIVGQVDPEEVFAVMERYFGDWSGADRKPVVLPEMLPVLDRPTSPLIVALPDKSNVDILIGRVTDLSANDDQFLAATLVNNILGGDTIAGVLGKEIRVKHGLTYGIYSVFGHSLYGSAPWYIQLSVNPDNVDKALALVQGVIDKFASDGISDQELSDAIAAEAGQFTVNMRSNEHIASNLSRFIFDGISLDKLDQRSARFAAITKDQANAAIRKYLRLDDAVTVVAGTLN